MTRLYRSKENRIIAGICGGVGEIINLDPTIIRLAFVFLGVLTGVVPLAVVYLIGRAIIPEGTETGKKPAVRLYRSRENKMIAGICGGIGEMSSMDPTIIRLIFVFLAIVTAVVPFVIIYLVAWAIIPYRNSGQTGQ